MNLRNLERVLAREEEVKRKAIVHKTVYSGPQIRYISQNGMKFFMHIDIVLGHCIFYPIDLAILSGIILNLLIH